MEHVRLTVFPDSPRARVIAVDDTYEVYVDAPAEGGRANKRLVQLLQKVDKWRGKRIRIVSGHRSPHKIIEIQ